MNRKTKQWLRLVYPPWWIFAFFLALYLAGIAFAWSISYRYGTPEIAAEVARMCAGTVVCFAGFYGLLRAVYFHPAISPSYAAWLQATPWTYRHPLPRGPVRLVSQDVMLLAAMTPLAFPSSLSMVLVPIGFLAAYLAATMFLLGYTGVRSIAYVLAAGLGLAVYLHESPLGVAALLALLYAPAWWGLRESFKRFPWPLVEAARRREKIVPIGWPQNQFFPKEPEVPLGTGDRIALGLLAGWWFYVFLGLVKPSERADAAIAICVLASLAAAVWRIVSYCINHWPPISLWGRLRTGRWIIPGYDKIFVAPLCVVAVVLVTVLWRPRPGELNLAWCAASLSASLLIVLLMGPSYRSWTLTGEHRIVASNLNTDRTKLARR